ncbi:MAG: 5'-3' exonuclease H3TH domain-containing protein, partial [Candidatus Adiutrix sp.]
MISPIYLMDASSFIHRAFHAIRNLTNAEGQPTGAIYGFTATVLKLLKEKKPQAFAVIFDSKGPSRRHEIFSQYKANRGPMDPDLVLQQQYIRDIVSYLGLFSFEKSGYEADDLIAAATKRFAESGHEVVIISGDKDFYQLLSPKVSMYDPAPKKDSALTEASFRERFAIAPKEFLDMQALMGDLSDNIPGVPQVGPKTAQKLVAKFGSIDKIYENIEQVTPEKLRQTLIEHKTSAYLSLKLAALGEGTEFNFTPDDLRIQEPDMINLSQLFEKLDFSRLLKDISGLMESNPHVPEIKKVAQTISYDNYVLVDNQDAWEKLQNSLNNATTLAVDLETDSPSPSRCRIVGLSLCAEPGVAYYIPISHQTLGAVNQDWEKVKSVVGPCLTSERPKKVGQNAKFDWLILRRHGLNPAPASDDPMLASYLLNA